MIIEDNSSIDIEDNLDYDLEKKNLEQIIDNNEKIQVTKDIFDYYKKDKPQIYLNILERNNYFNVSLNNLNLKLVGKIENIVNNKIIIKPYNEELFSLNTIIFIKEGNDTFVLGKIDDIMGNLDNKYFLVLYDDFLKNINISNKECFIDSNTAQNISETEIDKLKNELILDNDDQENSSEDEDNKPNKHKFVDDLQLINNMLGNKNFKDIKKE